MAFCLTSIELKSLVAGTLPDGAASRAKKHLKECTRCRKEYEAFVARAGSSPQSPPEARKPAPEPAAAPAAAGTAPGGPDSGRKGKAGKGKKGSSKKGGGANVPGSNVKKAKAEPAKPAPASSGNRAAETAASGPGAEPARSAKPQEGAGTEFEIPGFRLLQEAPDGSHAAVCDAVDERTGRGVRLRILPADSAASETERRRFETEVERAAGLHEQHLVRVFGGGIAGNRRWLALAPVLGVPIDVWAREHKPGARATLELFLKVLEAIRFGHLKGIFHRSIRPDLVLVDEEGEPAVEGFGPAEAWSTGGGWSPWSPPETLMGGADAADARADVYGLGSLLYLLLTGRPWLSDPADRAAGNRAVLETLPDPPSRYRPEVDRDLDAIVLRSLQKDPANRYQSVGELGADVARYLRGRPVEARSEEGWYVVRKTLGRLLFGGGR